jgi:tryptophan synthase beta chain
MGEQVKYVLGERDIPTHWVNLMADIASPDNPPLPPLHPQTKQPAGPEDLAPLFPMALIEQEVSAEPLIEIPDAVRDACRLWRPDAALPGTAPREWVQNDLDRALQSLPEAPALT